MDHVLSTLLVLALGYTFALRSFNPFWLAIFTAQLQANAAGGGIGVEGAAAPPGGGAPGDRILSPPLSVALAAAASGVEGNEAAPRSIVAVDPRSSPDGSPRAASDAEYHSMPSSESHSLRAVAGAPPSASPPVDAPATLWRPGVRAPPASACLPQGTLASVWLRAAGAARAPASDAVNAAPVLVLECPLADDSSAVLMLGTASAAVPPDSSASAGGVACGAEPGGAVDQSAWSALPPAALPYLPSHIRMQLQSQARLAQLDSRRSHAPDLAAPASSRAGRAHTRPGAASSSAARTRYSRIDSFPDHI